MTATEPQKKFGRLVHPMDLNPNGNDRVEHTLVHFLEPNECWEELRPRLGKTPEDFRNRIRQRKFNREDASRILPESERKARLGRWWQEPRLELVEEAHHQGYWPRYLHLVESCGSIDVAGARWTGEHDGRLRGEFLGFVVFVVPVGREGLQVVTSYRNFVTRSEGVARPLRSPVARLLKAWCQDAGAALSSKARGSDT